MEFLKTCNTNAQAIGDFEAIAYQAFSITRTTTPTSSRTRDWNTSEDIRAVEAQLRQDLQLVAQDASRPWLWLFKPTTVDKLEPNDAEPPELDGYRLHSEQTGCTKAIDLVRPPMRPGNPNTTVTSTNSPSATQPQRGLHAGSARSSQGNSQPQASDSRSPPDCFTIYELFTSSVIALISFNVVKDCNVTALNYRTFVSKACKRADDDPYETEAPAPVHRLTSVNVHWASSGTLLVSTYTDYKTDIRCIGDISTQAEEKWLTGKCIRVAPNGLLATISSFDDPLDSIIEEIGLRHRKRTRLATLEQSIESWKSSVKRWLGWKGYALPNLEKKSSWFRIRTTLTNSPTASSPAFAGSDRDVLWPRALCFFHSSEEHDMTSADSTVGGHSMLRWYETPESMGFKDPLDAAQEWFLGKPDRDKILEARRKAKKAEEDSARRKDEQQNLFPSSPLNARGGAYGDLHAVGGVYPTPPDGVAPGTAVSHSDTPSVSGTVSNVILAPGGSNPAINLSAPQADTKMDEQQMPSTSPVVPSAPDNFNVSSGNDDLFGDMDEDGYGGDRINDDDFDFFDEPDDNDVDMLDAPALPETNVVPTDTSHEQESQAAAEHPPEEDSSDPFAALESALATASEPAMDVEKEDKGKQPMTTEMPLIESPDLSDEKSVAPIAKAKVSFSKEPTPPLSPSAISKALQPSPPKKLASHTRPNQPVDTKNDAHFSPVVFSRKMSMSDAKYQDGRFSAHRPVDSVNQNSSSPSPGPRPVVTQTKSLRDIPLLSKLRITVGAASTNQIPEIASLARAASENSDSSDISDESDEDSGEGEEEEAGTTPAAIIGGLIMPAKRKLQSDGNATPLSVTSFADSMGGDWHDLHGLQVDELNLTSFEPSLWDWSLVHFPSPVERRTAGARYSLPSLHASPAQMPDTPTSQPEMSYEVSEEKPLSAKDSISITQIVTDQIVKTTLDLLGEGLPFEKEPVNEAIAETRWHTVIKEIFPAAAECDLPTLAGVHEVFQDYAALAKAQQRPAARKNDGPAVTGSHLYQINAPFLRVRRAETHWDLLPPAVAFWEPLGLSPISSPKNVVTFCIYPHSDALRPCLENFLLNLQLAYDSCKLGTHSRVETVVEFEGGLVPVRANSTVTPAESFKLLKETCVQLGKLLAIQHAKIREQQDSKIDAFVIYMVDPFGGPSALWELCSAFWVLFQAYGQGSPGRPDQPQKPDLVLQVVPMKYIASFDTPVILDPSTYFSLAREVYDRCPPSAPSGDKTSLSIYAAPAFHLEETLPRNIPFKLISEPAQDLLRENTYMHLGYAISLDGTWVTAAWTDSCGKSQAVVSYHLGTRMFREVAKEIWQTTIEILQSRRVNWRVCIAKAGVLEREELETWVFLISCPTQINVFVTLLTAIDADPPYKFTPTMTGPSTAIGGSTNTPESTPQAGVSPSDLGPGLTPAATPSADPSATDPSADPEARLIDVTDETWGVILAHRLHNTQSTTQFSPALISGLLVKRGETQQTRNSISHPIPDPEPGPIVVAVNFLWIGAVGSTRAASSPFPPSSSGSTPSAASTSSDLPSPGASTLPNPYASNPGTPQSPGPAQDAGQRSTTSLMWTPTPQTRTTAEGLLKEVLGQFRALGLLAKLRGMRGTRNGTLPWHLVAAKRGVEGLSRIGGAV